MPAPALEVVEVLGVGGMGIVYRATQTDLERPIAYKRLIDHPTPEARARFMREARLTAQLDHPNIVPVHLLDPGSDASPGGYAMKLVEGKTLAQILAEARAAIDAGQPLDADHSLQARLEIFLKVCDAIAFAHDRRVLHRDLKPANVMIGAFGAVYVMDWGIARPFGADAPAVEEVAPAELEARKAGPNELTRVGAIVGTLQYMSPEQARGENDRVDARADQYALGLLLHEIVSLSPAYTGGSEAAIHEAVAYGRKPPLTALDGREGRAPRELWAVVGRATELSPHRRYADVRALAEDVRRYLRNEAPVALPDGPLGKVLRFIGRHRRTTLTAFTVVLAASVLSVVWLRYRQAQAELATQRRGAELTSLYGDVARQAHRIDSDLFRMERALEGLATAAEWALTGPEPSGSDAVLYFDDDMKDASRRAADFTDKTAYRWPVSVEHPVVGLAPGLDRTALLPRIRRLAPLRRHIMSMVVAAAVGDTVAVDRDRALELLRSRKSPIDYAYVDLPEGVHYVWPGVDALPPGYDVRTSSFYQLSDHEHGTRWGAPYVDSTTDAAGDDLVLPCTRGLWSPSGEFLGVAGVEITVTKMVETTMVLPGHHVVRASLVDDKARVVVDSRDANKRFHANGKDIAIDFLPFDLPDIAAAIRAGGSGLRETTRDGRRIVVAFVRLAAIGWSYVVEIAL